jgi:hypothetical protein
MQGNDRIDMSKKFALVAAKVEVPDIGTFLVVHVPWAHFSNALGIVAYTGLVHKAQYPAVCVSQSPTGVWQCDQMLEGAWAAICAVTPPDKLVWRDMEIESAGIFGELMEEAMKSQKNSVDSGK